MGESHCENMSWSLTFILSLVALPGVARATWVLSNLADECNNACTNAGSTCFAGGMNALDSAEKLEFVAITTLGTTCASYQGAAANIDPSRATNNNCYFNNAASSTCADISPGNYQRFCCCGTSIGDCPTAASTPTPTPTSTSTSSSSDSWVTWVIVGVVLGVVVIIGSGALVYMLMRQIPAAGEAVVKTELSSEPEAKAGD